MLIPIETIAMDKGAQPREEINSELVQEYAGEFKNGAQFPPVIVFYDGEKHFLADGWHRVLAAMSVGKSEIDAEIKPGGLRDAVLYSTSANSDHGLRRTNADKRRAVKVLLADPIWCNWSSREIARQVKVSHTFVDQLQLELKEITGNVASDLSSSNVRKYIDRQGNISTMQVRVQDDTPITAGKHQFNRTNDNIEWAAWSWNPVTGCKHGCSYCYARDIANRFYPEGFTPTFRPERLEAPANTNPLVCVSGGANVFVCSMADLFGEWVSNDWIIPVLESVKKNPQWSFIFLTKNPRRLTTFDFPDNAWVGTTVDVQARVEPAKKFLSQVNARVKFVSCEPLLERLTFGDMSMFDWVIIGGKSSNSQEQGSQPDWEWVYHLTDQAYKSSCKVYWKPNLTIRPKEYPK